MPFCVVRKRKRLAVGSIVLFATLLLIYLLSARTTDSVSANGSLPMFSVDAISLPLKDHLNMSSMVSHFDLAIRYKEHSTSSHNAAALLKQVLKTGVSLNRSLDYRRFECRTVQYDLQNLPTASIIIIVTNEPWNMLLRAIRSVIDNSPSALLKEVILIDRQHIMPEPNGTIDLLSNYASSEWPHGRVLIKRTGENAKLTQARHYGAQVANGDVVIFLDAYCEVTPGWLEPLLERIHICSRCLLSPQDFGHREMADDIRNDLMGGFMWSLNVMLLPISHREIMRRRTRIDPIRSPVIAGHLLAVDRRYYFEIGGYDVDIDVGENFNLELSLRAWMCGAAVEYIPCSRVWHGIHFFAHLWHILIEE